MAAGCSLSAMAVGGLLSLPELGVPQTQVQAQSGGIVWMTNLEQARQVAAAQGRPILIHFWNDNCPPCVGVERNVFSRPEVARALAAGFVAVKIKVDDAPEVAKWFRVDRWPMDIVLTSEGKELLRTVSPQDPQRYVTMLTQAGAAMLPAVPAALNAINPAVATTAQPGAPSDYVGGAFVPPHASGASFSGNAPAVPQGTSVAAQAGPYQGGAGLGMSPGDQGGPYAAPSPAPNANFISGQAGQFQAGTAPTSALPSPQLGMDGYCTVTLMSQHQWKRGDVRWGAVHRDRTYLFAGPEEQQKFLANPDRFAPMLSGFDPVQFAQYGTLVPGRRQHGVWFQDQMYLFVDEPSLKRFGSSPAAFAGRAEQAMRGATYPQPNGMVR